MKKSNEQFFHMSKHSAIREHNILWRATTTVAVFLVCLMAMSISAYAYFTCDSESHYKVIATAKFETNVSVQLLDSEGELAEFCETTRVYKTYQASLEPGQTYRITITLAASNTASTGFVVINGDGCKTTYYTQQLGADAHTDGGRTETLTFDLSVSESTTVTFLMHWGTASCYDAYQNVDNNDEIYVIQGDEIQLDVVSEDESDENAEETEEEETEESLGNKSEA